MMELAEDQKMALEALARDLFQSGCRISVRRFSWALQGVDQDYADAIVSFWEATWGQMEEAQG
jgi:hypothetical protein